MQNLHSILKSTNTHDTLKLGIKKKTKTGLFPIKYHWIQSMIPEGGPFHPATLVPPR